MEKSTFKNCYIWSIGKITSKYLKNFLDLFTWLGLLGKSGERLTRVAWIILLGNVCTVVSEHFIYDNREVGRGKT